MPRGASAKREREYNELKHEFKKEGRYKGREEEVAARIVNKQRSRFGETKTEKRKDREGRSPDRNLPIREYQHKTIDQVQRAIAKLSRDDLKQIEKYEKQHKNRKTLLEAMREQMKGGNGSSTSSKKSKSSSKNSRNSSSKSKTRSSSGAKSKSGSSSKSDGSGHGGNVTTDHDFIRRWAEERNAKPSAVIRTESDGDVGIIRLDFPGYSGAGALEEISWEDWFQKFEESKLAFLYQDETADGKKSNFNKLISR